MPKKRIYSWIAAIAVIIMGLSVGLLSGCTAEDGDSGQQPSVDQQEPSEKEDENMPEKQSGAKPKVEITMEDGGKILVELDPSAAPVTVENYLSLVNKGFYDGLTFHRIIPGFMIQGGDPEGTGMGGSDKNIKGEFSKNGVDNKISHKRGVISMARSQDFNSASSQFFITNADALFLDGQYAAFGQVLEGMDVVDKISAVATDGNDKPTTPVKIMTIKEVQ
jgi:peptidyl-prolyl cis-trans isomerase B (cyclophilin B)